MVYRWCAAWVKHSAVPGLLDDDGRPLLNNITFSIRYPDGVLPGPRDSYVFPDVIFKYSKKDGVGYTVSLSDRAASILARIDRHIELEPHVVRWRDGSIAQRRHILVGFPQLFPLDEKLSRYKKPNGWDARLVNLDDRYVFDRLKIGSHHVWRCNGIDSTSFFGSDELIDEFVKSGVTGLSLEQYAEQRDGVVSGPKHDPSQYVFRMIENGASISQEPLDGDFSLVRPACSLPEKYKWIWIGGRKTVAYGLPVLPDNMPTKWRYGSKERHLPGFDCWGGAYTVNQQFRDIIEHFEPNLHQFFPVDFVTRKGELIEKRFIMVICKIIDSRDNGRSEPGLSDLWPAESGYRRRIVVDRAKVTGSHLWLDHYYGHNNDCFVSYELARALERANPKRLHFTPFPLN